MEHFPIFLSCVIILKNDGDTLKNILENVTDDLKTIVSDYEIVVVDNGSTDNSVNLIKELTLSDGLPNLQAYALTKTVDRDTAAWVGLENALGDLDFVNSYNIEKFDSKMIIYKVYYNSSPKRFLKDILSYGINIDTSSSNWIIE